MAAVLPSLVQEYVWKERGDSVKTRMRFTKTGSVKFIGHLDCMRFFQKAIRRAKLDVAYSQGYSPHQLMSFASPLGVGITSDGEYMDVEFHSLPEDKSLAELAEYLNQFMTEEIFVTEIEIMPEGFKNSMSLLRTADYMIVEKEEGILPADYKEKWLSFMEQPQILVTKKSKKTEREIDIKENILLSAFSLAELCEKTGEDYGTLHCQYEGEAIYMQLTSGSSDSVKPELVLSAFYHFCGVERPAHMLQVHRLQMHFADIPKKGGA